MIREELHPETVKYLREADLKHRKELGQYFTPRTLRETLLSKLPKIKNPKILDPASGTGEFLETAKEYFADGQIYGWEIDPALVSISKKIAPYARVECTDSLKENGDEKFDFVIGNPPYFEFKPDTETRGKYEEILNGRVNIYGIFVYKGIQLLREGGCLAYVIPPSMNNGAYFSKLRNFIVAHCNIEFLSIQKIPTIFKDALQTVMLLVLKKGRNVGSYLFKKNGILIFSQEKDHLEEVFKNSATLSDFGYRVQTGKLVWNQNKDLLTNNPTGNVPLIWSHNITRDGVKLEKNEDKPQFVKTSFYERGPVIVTNRIIGQPHKGSLKAAIVPENMKFVAENHVNVIYPAKHQSLSPNSKKITLENVVKQLNSPENADVLWRITGNTQISKNELEKLFPIRV